MCLDRLRWGNAGHLAEPVRPVGGYCEPLLRQDGDLVRSEVIRVLIADTNGDSLTIEQLRTHLPRADVHGSLRNLPAAHRSKAPQAKVVREAKRVHIVMVVAGGPPGNNGPKVLRI